MMNFYEYIMNESTQEQEIQAFLAAIEEGWPHDEAIASMAVFADWLEENNHPALPFFRPLYENGDLDWPEPFEVSESEEFANWPDEEGEPEIDYDVIQDHVPTNWEEVVNQIKNGYYHLVRTYGNRIDLDSGESTNYATGEVTQRNMRIAGLKGTPIHPIACRLLLRLAGIGG